MLPTEAFAEAVAFLRLFDLKALVVTNALCSSLAAKHSNTIRWEEFQGLRFYIANEWIQISRRTDAPAGEDWHYVAELTFPNEDDMVEFVAAAFPNCVFEDMDIPGSTSKRIFGAIGRVADSVIVNRVLSLDNHMSPKCSLSLVRKFRKVKALQFLEEVSDDEVIEIAKFYRGCSVQELRYYPSYRDPTPKIFALF